MRLDVTVHLAPNERRTSLEADARAGLGGAPKSLPPTWFYDERGSELFEEITRLPEYYPTRAERSILLRHGADIVDIAKVDTLVELGSGSSEKTRLLLDAMAATGRLERFVPFDVSESALRASAGAISAAYGIEVCAIVGDFHRHIPEIPRSGRRLIAFLGGTIGNLRPPERRTFLAGLGATMGSDDWFLLGTDLEKDLGRLVEAYDDAAGVTAAFNRNVLAVLNNELGADFDLGSFSHVARWNAEERWIEMWLRADSPQQVRLQDIGLSIEFAEGEELLTEISAKFTAAGIARELAEADLIVEASWTDAAGDFLLSLARSSW